MLDKGVTPLLGWTELESIMFECLIDYIIPEKEDLDVSTCLEAYNNLRMVAEQHGVKGVGMKTSQQIQGKINHVKRCAAVYEALFKKQVERNWFTS